MPRDPEQLRALVESYLDELSLTPELGTLVGPMRHALGGKRVRPVLCLATGDAIGARVENLLPAAAAIELVHSFSLVHDDLPALDDDDERRGRPSVHVAFGEAVALLAGDALLAEAFALAGRSGRPELVRELAGATLGMIGGQYLDVTRDDDDLARLHRLKTGRLFLAAVLMGLEVAGVAEDERTVWLALGDDVGLLFQVVDDLLDGDGYAARLGAEDARQLAQEVASRARARLDELAVDTSVLRDLVDMLAVRTG